MFQPLVLLEFAFQLWVIVFQSNSLHRSGRYEFTWRKYRPILHRHVINPSICTYDIVYMCMCVCVCTRWWKSRGIFQARRNPISLRSMVKLALLERSMPINARVVRSMFRLLRISIEIRTLVSPRTRTSRIFDLWFLCRWINRAIRLVRRNWVKESCFLPFSLSSVNVIRVQFNFQERRIFINSDKKCYYKNGRWNAF